MRRLIFMALTGVLCILFGSVARAQRLDGTLHVTITDNSQASIEDAKVTADIKPPEFQQPQRLRVPGLMSFQIYWSGPMR